MGGAACVGGDEARVVLYFYDLSLVVVLDEDVANVGGAELGVGGEASPLVAELDTR